MNTFSTLYKAGITKRWHTHDTIKQQSVAEHSWGVALICSELMPDSINLMKAALYHDLAESKYGDIPYTSKREDVELKRRSEVLETNWDEQHGIAMALTAAEMICLKWADMFEAYLFACREARLGNKEMIPVVDTAWRALGAMELPSPKAFEMLRECAQ